MKPLLLVGGGGHCKSCIDVIEKEGKYRIDGIIDRKERIGGFVLNYPVIADDSKLEEFVKQGFAFLVTVGQIQTPNIRKDLFDRLKKNNAEIGTVISPFANVSHHAVIGAGTIVMHGAIVNAGVVIGDNVILNTNCLIEHDAVVGNNVHVSTHVVINGSVAIEDGCFIGSNSTLVNHISIASHAIIGAGSVVVRDIDEPGVYVGNPAKKIKK